MIAAIACVAGFVLVMILLSVLCGALSELSAERQEKRTKR